MCSRIYKTTYEKEKRKNRKLIIVILIILIIGLIFLQKSIANKETETVAFVEENVEQQKKEGLILNTGFASKTKSYTHKGLKVDTVFTDKIINMAGDKKTVIEALEQTSFSKVYIMLGINETGWVYSSLFIKKYAEIIDTIKQINPDAIIYVQSILPVSEKVSAEHDYLHNDKINEYNSLIQQMTSDKQVYYINVREAIETANGSLPEEATTDGIHLNKSYCIKWLDYLKSHVVR